MPSAFFTGLTGLRAHAKAVEVVANNLANLNSISFKKSRSNFSDLFYQEVGQVRSGISSQVGIGTAPVTVSRIFEQGSIQSTGGLLDAAIQGDGFFVVDGGGLVQYTRAGIFSLNADQEMVTLSGQNLQGWVRDRSTGIVDTGLPLSNITLQGFERIEPTATSNLSVNGNLQVGSTRPFSRPVQVFDSLGEAHLLTLTFAPLIPPRAGFSSSYDITVTIPASDVVEVATLLTPVADPNLVVGTGPGGEFAIDFDATGSLVIPGGAAPYAAAIDMTLANPVPVQFANGATDLLISWDFLDQLEQPRLTSVAAASAVTDIFQDGSASAELTKIVVANGGRINGLYSDGRTVNLAIIGLSRFTNPQALAAVGDNNYVTTEAAGIPVSGEAGVAGLGEVVGLSLEFSNVDIAEEFTNLLTFQRGFQANSRVITTADEMNQEALDLKR